MFSRSIALYLGRDPIRRAPRAPLVELQRRGVSQGWRGWSLRAGSLLLVVSLRLRHQAGAPPSPVGPAPDLQKNVRRKRAKRIET
jgi:hypothetical protein